MYSVATGMHTLVRAIGTYYVEVKWIGSLSDEEWGRMADVGDGCGEGRAGI